MSARGEYVAALRTERENLARRPDSPANRRRVAEVDVELGRYQAEPDVAVIEAAVPGPITSARARRVVKPKSDK
jgi:hypothetical protein